MFTTARKLGVLCFILVALNIAGLVMVALLFAGQNIAFYIIFAWLMYMITVTAISLLLTFAVRTLAQDSDMQAETTALQIKKLKDRIDVLEKKL